MSYRKKSGLQYSRPMRHTIYSPSTYQRFREDWETGLNAALARAEALRKEGWTIDVDRGALMGGQAKKMEVSFESAGFETQTIPVAKWSGEDVVFLAYKQRSRAETAAETTKPKPIQPVLTPEDLFVAYKKEFYGSNEPPETDVDGDMIMSSDHISMLIPRDAVPTKDTFVGAAKILDGVKKLGEFIYTPSLDTALEIEQKKMGKEYISMGSGDEAVNIDHVRRGLKVLGRGNIEMYGGEAKPTVFTNQEGDKFVIAPAVGKDASEVTNWPQVTTITP